MIYPVKYIPYMLKQLQNRIILIYVDIIFSVNDKMSNNVRRVSDSYRTILIYLYYSVYVKQC